MGTGGRVAGRSAEGNISDAVTSAMMNQFARELTSSLAGSLSWPGVSRVGQVL